MPEFPIIVFRPAMALDQVAAERQDTSYAAAEAAVERWQTAMGLAAVDRSGDFEDWHENAALFFAALESGAPVMVVPPGPRRNLQAIRQFNGAPACLADLTEAIEIGRIASFGPWEHPPLWPTPAMVRAADGYADTATFARHAGRAVAVAYGLPADGDDADAVTLVAAIQALARDGHRDLLIKNVTRGKYAPLEPFQVENPENADAIATGLMQRLGYDLIYNDSGRPRFLVQERIEIKAEYRIAVIDGQPRAGAGCIEQFCPVYNPDRLAFHPAVEGQRGDGAIVDRPDLITAYLDKARLIAREMAAEAPAANDVILDFGRKPTGEVVLIEVNPATRFGLYALDYGLVLAPVLDRLAHRPTPVVAP